MNVLDRLDQLERGRVVGTFPADTHIVLPRAHLRALLDVARAAQRTRGSEITTGWPDLMAALAPLLEDTE